MNDTGPAALMRVLIEIIAEPGDALVIRDGLVVMHIPKAQLYAPTPEPAAPAAPRPPTPPRPKTPRMNRAQAVIDAMQPGRRWSINEVAQALHISSSLAGSWLAKMATEKQIRRESIGVYTRDAPAAVAPASVPPAKPIAPAPLLDGTKLPQHH